MSYEIKAIIDIKRQNYLAKIDYYEILSNNYGINSWSKVLFLTNSWNYDKKIHNCQSRNDDTKVIIIA